MSLAATPNSLAAHNGAEKIVASGFVVYCWILGFYGAVMCKLGSLWAKVSERWVNLLSLCISLHECLCMLRVSVCGLLRPNIGHIGTLLRYALVQMLSVYDR